MVVIKLVLLVCLIKLSVSSKLVERAEIAFTCDEVEQQESNFDTKYCEFGGFVCYLHLKTVKVSIGV